MAGSTLTVRTLALATVALVLACGHAVKAMGDQRAAADRVVNRAAPSVAPIRVVPAGSGHSTIATFSNNGRGSSGSGSSRVATFTSKGGGSGGSVVTFGGDRVERRVVASSTTRKPQPAARTKPKGGILPLKGDPPVIAVRRPAPPQQTPINDKSYFVGPPAPEPSRLTVAAPPKQSQPLRNAFGGITRNRAPIETAVNEPLVYAHASR